MNKKIYKGYELIKAIAEQEIKDGTKIKASFNGTLIEVIEYKNNKLNWKQNGNFSTEYLCSRIVIFEILEDNTEEIEELNHYNVISAIIGKTNENINNELAKITKKINELVRAVNQIRKEKE